MLDNFSLFSKQSLQIVKCACVVILVVQLSISLFYALITHAELSARGKGIIPSKDVLVINVFALKSHSALRCSKKLSGLNYLISF